MKVVGLFLFICCFGCASAPVQETITLVTPEDNLMKFVLGYEGSYATEFGCDGIENFEIKRPEDIDVRTHVGVILNIVVFESLDGFSNSWVRDRLSSSNDWHVFLDPDLAPLNRYGRFSCQTQGTVWVCYDEFRRNVTCADVYEDIRFVVDRYRGR